MAKIERTYTIPLRKEWLKSPKYRRAKKAVTAVKDFLIKHMKSEDIRLGKYLNEELWKHGIKNPPCRIKVNVVKDDKNVVRAEIFGKEIATEKKKEEVNAKLKGIATKMKETITGKKDEKKLPVKKKKEEKPKAEENAKLKEEVKEEAPTEQKAEPERAKLKEAPKPEAPNAKLEEDAKLKEKPKLEPKVPNSRNEVSRKAEDAKLKPAEK